METAANGAESGMPQLDFATFPNQLFWLVIALIVIYLILSRVALPRIGTVLAERSGTITNDLAAAEELKTKAAEAEKAYEQALADARAEANKIIDRAKAEMRAELDVAIAKADAEIAAKQEESEMRIAEIRSSAQDTVHEVARDTTQAVLEAMGSEADAATIDAAVKARANRGDAA